MSSNSLKRFHLGELVAINELSINPSFTFEEIEYIDTASVTQNIFQPPKVIKLGNAPSRAKRIIRAGDTIISTVRPIQKHYGFIKHPKPNTIASTGFAVLTPKKINPSFLFYYLTQDRITEYLNTIAETTTTTFPAFRPDILNELEVSIPENLEVQNRIASILSSLDDAIELNQQTNKTLEEITKAIFKEMCLPKSDELPKGWRIESLDKVAEFLNGLALQKYPAKEGEDYLPVIKIRELKNGITNSTDKANLNLPEKYIIKDGDLLFSWSATLEVKFWNDGIGALNQHLFKVTSKKYPLWFCYLLIQYHLKDFRKIALDKTTTMGHIQRNHLTEAMCFISKDLEKIDKILSPIIQQIQDNEQENRTLKSLRDLLLPKLMKGEIEINKLNFA